MTDEKSAPVLSSSADNLTDLAGGAVVNFVGKLGRLTKTTFVAVIKLLFGLEVVGLYETAWGIAFALSKVGMYGLHRGVVKEVVEARASGDGAAAERSIGAALGLGLVLSLVVTIVVAPTATLIVDKFYPQYPTMVPAIQIMVWAIPLLTLTGIFIAATRALRIMRYDVYVTSIAGPLILLAGGAVAGFAGMGLEELSIVQLVMAVGMCLLAGYYFTNCFSLTACLRHMGNLRQWGTLHRFSLPVMILELLANVLTRLDIAMILYFVGAPESGLYAIARRAASATLKIPQSFDPIFSSIVSDLAFRRDYRELGARLVSVARWSLTVNLALTAAVLLAGDVILSLLGDDTVLATDPLVVLCLGMLVYSVFVANEQLLIMSGRQYLSLFDTILWVVLNVGLNLWLIPEHGLVGAAVASSVAMNVVAAVRIVQVYVIYGCHPFDWSQLKPLSSAMLALAVGFGVMKFSPLGPVWAKTAACVAFMPVYLGGLYVLGLDPEDRLLLNRAARRLRLRATHESGDDAVTQSG